jgi:hypothetical protein
LGGLVDEKRAAMEQHPLADASAPRSGTELRTSRDQSGSDSRIRHRLLTTLTVISFAVPVAAYLLFVHHYAVNMIWLDQWSDLSLISHADSNTLNLGTIWAQHTQDRIFFPNLIVLALARTTHLNVVVEEYLGAVMLILATGLIIWADHRRSPNRPWLFYSPVVIVMLSFIQYRDTFWGFQMAWYLVMLALATALFLLDRAQLTWVTLLGAMAAAVVGSYSSLEGLFIWPVGLLLLYLRRRSFSLLVTWGFAGLAAVGLYFYHYSLNSTAASSNALAHPVVTLKTLLFNLGNVLGAYRGSALDVSYLLGLVFLVVAVYVVIAYGLRRNEEDGSPLGVALVWFGLLFAALVTFGRTSDGVSLASRYALFDNLIVVGCYLSLFNPPTLRISRDRVPRLIYHDGPVERFVGLPTQNSPGRRWDETCLHASRAFLVLALFLLLTAGTLNGLSGARSWYQKEVSVVDVTVNIDAAPNTMVKSVLFFEPPRTVLPQVTTSAPIPSYIRQMTRFAEKHRLAMFDTGAVEKYRKQGLPRTATVVALRRDTQLSGTQTLGATASSNVAVTGVDFILTGDGWRGSVVAEARKIDHGWLASWNSDSVPNGTYTLQSVTHDASGHSTYSKGVVVRVANQPT